LFLEREKNALTDKYYYDKEGVFRGENTLFPFVFSN